MSSPSFGPSNIPCKPFDAVLGDQNNVACQVDDNFFSDFESPSFPELMDICMSTPDIYMVDRAFGDNDDFDAMCSDDDLSPTNSVCAMDAIDSHHGAPGEESQQMSDYMSFETMPIQNFNSSHSQFDYMEIDNYDMEIDNYDTEAFVRTPLDMTHEPNSLLALVGAETIKKKHTLCLDLDETLIHAEFTPCHGVDFTYQITDSDNNDETVYVRKRPFLDEFLRRVSEIFEVIIFTASLSCYSEKLLDILDPKGKFFSARRYRSSCAFLDNIYTKDLTVLGIDLAKVCIVDNYPEVFRLQPDNGIPIESWYEDDSDSALMQLLQFLESLVDVDDVRPIIAQKFRAS